jgi:UPF0755 protein
MSKPAKFLLGLFIGVALSLGLITWINRESSPTAAGKEFYIRWEGQSFAAAAQQLEDKGVLRNASVFGFFARLEKKSAAPADGTYQFRPGMTTQEVLTAMRTPVKQMVRIPEGWWISRVAKRLEEKNVCKAEEYIELAGQPEKFKDVVSFQLPDKSLEGYLYPDTYELPPELGAEGVIRRQLQAFEKKVASKVDSKDLHKAVIVGSMVELEAALEPERARVAGVIQNRIDRGMRLEIDATVLYALGEWKELGPGVVRTVESPYNTYLNAGLPPGPIGSPGASSILAALAPEEHPYLFYVARPDRSHIFSRTYSEHLANIRKARAEWRASREEGA